ncbi:PP2C family protein-serine/threonine phosphatase [Nocardioides scoriae]|nr:PP2C family protein-serine/threonine phosphatase [Nocardioides scoriae]
MTSGTPRPLDAVADQVRRAVDRLLAAADTQAPDELPRAVADAAGELGAADAVVHLADLQQRQLVPLPPAGSQEPGAAPLGVDSTLAGRAFQTLQPVSGAGPGERVQLWLPLLDGSERLGVLGLTVQPGTALADEPAGLRAFASALAHLLVTRNLYGDALLRPRRSRPLTLAAEIQWSLLPPLTFSDRSVTVAGGMEPAYEVAGDSFDYAVERGAARFGVFDAMGHGIVSAQLINLVVAAYRNARRTGRTLRETADGIEEAVDLAFRVESFATGLLCHLDTDTGRLSWISAGHHAPLLLRAGRLVRELAVEPLLPLGLNRGLDHTAEAPVGTEQLEPGDLLLLYTDGVTEARSPAGEFFGRDRLVDLVSRHLAAGLPAAETVRRVVHALIDHQAGDVVDDATLLLVQWHGPPGAT